MNTKLLSVVLLALALAGCAAGVKRPQTVEAKRPCLSEREQVSSVSVSLTEEARKKALDNLKFNPDELLSHVKRGLEANNLLNGAGDQPRTHRARRRCREGTRPLRGLGVLRPGRAGRGPGQCADGLVVRGIRRGDGQGTDQAAVRAMRNRTSRRPGA